MIFNGKLEARTTPWRIGVNLRKLRVVWVKPEMATVPTQVCRGGKLSENAQAFDGSPWTLFVSRSFTE
jgi:hypothetical protein